MEDIVVNSDRKCPVALPCRRLRNINSFTPQGKVAAEISRCLHEFNHFAIFAAVRVLGVSKAIELFHKTAQIQREGGQLTANADRKRSPGGVFFGLVKTTATEEERKEIFKRERPKKKKKKRCHSEGTQQEEQNETEHCDTNEEAMEIDFSEDHLTTVVNKNAAVNEEDEDKATEEEKGKKKPIEGQPYTHAVASLSSDCLDLSDPGDFGIVPC